MLTIIEDDLSGQAVQDLVAFHLKEMHAHSPAGSVFALDLSGLLRADVTVWTAWQADRIAGVGALRAWMDGAGEVKSMRTHPDFIRTGVASALLDHIIDVARARSLTRLSLETGSGPAFEPALALYRRRGFVGGEPFGDYNKSDFNQFLHLAL